MRSNNHNNKEDNTNNPYRFIFPEATRNTQFLEKTGLLL